MFHVECCYKNKLFFFFIDDDYYEDDDEDDPDALKDPIYQIDLQVNAVLNSLV